MKLHHALAALALVLSSTLASAAVVDAVDGAERPPPPAVVEATDPWWQGFDDPQLLSLQHLASVNPRAGQGAPGGHDADVAFVLIGIRTLQARVALVQEIRAVVLRKRELARAEGPVVAAGQSVTELDARLAEADRIQAVFTQQNDKLVATLADLTGSPVDTARSFAVGSDPERTAIAIPTFQPETAPTPVVLTADDPVRTLDASAAQLADTLQARRADIEQAAHGWSAGTATERDLLEADERFLADQDAFAVVRAQLACAWIDAHVAQTATTTATTAAGATEKGRQ